MSALHYLMVQNLKHLFYINNAAMEMYIKIRAKTCARKKEKFDEANYSRCHRTSLDYGVRLFILNLIGQLC